MDAVYQNVAKNNAKRPHICCQLDGRFNHIENLWPIANSMAKSMSWFSCFSIANDSLSTSSNGIERAFSKKPEHLNHAQKN